MLTLAVLLYALCALAVQTILQENHHTYIEVCRQLESAISSASALYWPGDVLSPNPEYLEGIAHWALSSTQNSTCSVEPGTTEDVGIILRIVGSTRTPFAVKSGGHAANPGFSSTPGVHIALSRFNEVTNDPDLNSADVGAGLVWDDVYAALEPHGVNAVGARVSGIGVGGFTLGGGYSWTTNQYGLALDNVVAYELVMPNGSVVTVTEDEHPDLNWGLKGGVNNFGIVTKFTLKTHPQDQTQIWGGMIVFTEDYIEAFKTATAKFSTTVTDPKAAVIATFTYTYGTLIPFVQIFYDGPTPPDGIFDEYLAIPAADKDLKTRSFTGLITPALDGTSNRYRSAWSTVSLLNWTDNIMEAITNETKFWGEQLPNPNASVSYCTEPFLPSLYSHAPQSSSAWPPDRSVPMMPLLISFGYTLESDDTAMRAAVRESAERITAVARAEGQDLEEAALYGNYALIDTDLRRIFGQNLDRLETLKWAYDPGNVMGLAGGWKF